MAIHLPDGLPALGVLQAEGSSPARQVRARGWQPRPLEVAVLNLMPNKPATEVQLARLLASAPFDVRVTLVVPDGYVPHTTSVEHLARFYCPWSAIRRRQFDGLIVTGAPVETMPCEQVAYWPQLAEILDWTKEHVRRGYYICWGAMAALYHFHGIRTPVLPEKRFGVFEQTVLDPSSPYLRGFGERFPVPVSRRAELTAAVLPEGDGLQLLAESAESGICLLGEPGRGALYMFNHLEYDATTLRDEYLRDLQAGQPIAPPANYFPGEDPAGTPVNGWRPFAQLLFTNWLADICDAALPSGESEQALDWLLAEPAGMRGSGGFADFLIVADATFGLLPEILHRVESAGHRSLAAKVHRRESGTALIELRVEGGSSDGAERLAQKLLRSPGVRRIAQRATQAAPGHRMTHTSSEVSVHFASSPPRLDRSAPASTAML